MALSRANYSKVKQRISQWEATTGRSATPDIIRGFIEAELSEASGRMTQDAQLELQTKQLAVNQEQFDKSLAFDKERASRQDYLTMKANREQASAAKTSGYIQLGEFAFQAAQTDTGKAVIGGASRALGLGGGGQPAVTGQSVGSGAVGAVGGAGAVAVGGQGAVVGQGVGAGTGLSQAVSGPAAAGAGVGSGTGVGGAAAGSYTPTSTMATVGYASLASSAGAYLGQMVSDDEDAGLYGSIVGGAAYGALGGPVGIVAGAVIGAVSYSAERIYDEADRVVRRVGREARRVGRSIGRAVGTILCTELHRQGMLEEELCYLSAKYRKHNLSKKTYAGYLRWASPVVGWMKKSKTVTNIMYPVAKSYCLYAAHKLEPENYKKPGIFTTFLAKTSIWFTKQVGEWYYGRGK